MMDKIDKTGKLILFGSIALLVAGFIFQSKTTPPRREVDANATGPTPSVGTVDANQSSPNPSTTNTNTVPATPVISPAPPTAEETAEETAVLANAFVEYTFTTRGGESRT